MSNALKYIFGQGQYIFLYLVFYITIAFPTYLMLTEVDYILVEAEFTGPGFGTWLFVYLLSAYWSLLFFFIIVYSLKIKISAFLKTIIILFLISSFSIGSDFLLFIEIAVVNLSLLISNFYILSKLQDHSKISYSQEQKNDISKKTNLLFLISIMLSIIGIMILAYMWLPNGFNGLDL